MQACKSDIYKAVWVGLDGNVWSASFWSTSPYIYNSTHAISEKKVAHNSSGQQTIPGRLGEEPWAWICKHFVRSSHGTSAYAGLTKALHQGLWCLGKTYNR